MPDPSNQEFHLVIVNPNQVVYENEVKKVIAPGAFQDIAILPDHTPLYSELKAGDITITNTDDKTEKIPIKGGIIRVKINRVSIIEGF